MADTILNGKYTLLRELGRGTFGVVWLARHELLDGEERAVKILRRGVGGAGSTLYEQAKSRFEQEAQLGAQLNRMSSARTVRVFDFEREGEDLYLVMEYLPGGSLNDRLEKGPLPIADVIRIAREVAEGLAALHALDAVHRDIKPSNILFGADGAARLGDFGLAQTRRGMSLGTLGSDSAPRFQPGTPDYMSPEQSRGEARLSKASDVYALGVVLFECLTGKLYLDVKPGTDARSLRADCPAWLAQMIARMLKAEAGERPFDGRAIVIAVQPHLPTASSPSARAIGGIGLMAVMAGLVAFVIAPGVKPSAPNGVPIVPSPSPTFVGQEIAPSATPALTSQSILTVQILTGTESTPALEVATKPLPTTTTAPISAMSTSTTQPSPSPLSTPTSRVTTPQPLATATQFTKLTPTVAPTATAKASQQLPNSQTPIGPISGHVRSNNVNVANAQVELWGGDPFPASVDIVSTTVTDSEGRYVISAEIADARKWSDRRAICASVPGKFVKQCASFPPPKGPISIDIAMLQEISVQRSSTDKRAFTWVPVPADQYSVVCVGGWAYSEIYRGKNTFASIVGFPVPTETLVTCTVYALDQAGLRVGQGSIDGLSTGQ